MTNNLIISKYNEDILNRIEWVISEIRKKIKGEIKRGVNNNKYYTICDVTHINRDLVAFVVK